MTNDNFTEATLLYIIQDGRILMIRQKRGIGEDKINAPGGKVEEHDDSFKDATVRELREEIKVDVDPDKY
ncbi:MAG: NUDIX domain-containing protein [Candidatus Nanohaloarchaea archaeon]